jgi:hypothetical protein
MIETINRERELVGLRRVERDLTLQLAAEKRCADPVQLYVSYERMLVNRYDNEDWPKQEQLNQIASHGYS